jgi:hypothetical protein
LLPSRLAVGEHSVEVLHVRKLFCLTDKTVASKSDVYDCAGFEVCQARGIVVPVKEAGATKTGEYMNCKVVIVVGGLLL